DRGERRPGQQLLRRQDAERVGRLLPLLAAAGAGAVLAQVLPGVDAAVVVAPFDDEAVLGFLAQGRRHDRRRAGGWHGWVLPSRNRPGPSAGDWQRPPRCIILSERDSSPGPGARATARRPGTAPRTGVPCRKPSSIRRSCAASRTTSRRSTPSC